MSNYKGKLYTHKIPKSNFSLKPVLVLIIDDEIPSAEKMSCFLLIIFVKQSPKFDFFVYFLANLRKIRTSN